MPDITRRKSYQRWKELYEKLDALGLDHNQVAKVCRIIFMQVDRHHGYGSVRASQFSYESLERLLLDKWNELPLEDKVYCCL